MGRLAPPSGHDSLQPHARSGSRHAHHFNHGRYVRYVNIHINMYVMHLHLDFTPVVNVVTASKGLVDAAHFCYLMAQVGFGVFTKKSTKMVLIGSNHRYV